MVDNTQLQTKQFVPFAGTKLHINYLEPKVACLSFTCFCSTKSDKQASLHGKYGRCDLYRQNREAKLSL